MNSLNEQAHDAFKFGAVTTGFVQASAKLNGAERISRHDIRCQNSTCKTSFAYQLPDLLGAPILAAQCSCASHESSFQASWTIVATYINSLYPDQSARAMRELGWSGPDSNPR